MVGLLLASATVARADDAEEMGTKLVERLKGGVRRNEQVEGKPLIEVHLTGRLTDDDVKTLAALSQLQQLTLYDAELSGRELSSFRASKSLTDLRLVGKGAHRVDRPDRV